MAYPYFKRELMRRQVELLAIALDEAGLDIWQLAYDFSLVNLIFLELPAFFSQRAREVYSIEAEIDFSVRVNADLVEQKYVLLNVSICHHMG